MCVCLRMILNQVENITRFEVKCKCFRCGDGTTAGCRGQFLFRNEFINGISDNFVIGLCEIFVYFYIEFSVGQLSKSFLFVKVGAPNDHGTAFVDWFDDEF